MAAPGHFLGWSYGWVGWTTAIIVGGGGLLALFNPPARRRYAVGLTILCLVALTGAVLSPRPELAAPALQNELSDWLAMQQSLRAVQMGKPTGESENRMDAAWEVFRKQIQESAPEQVITVRGIVDLTTQTNPDAFRRATAEGGEEEATRSRKGVNLASRRAFKLRRFVFFSTAADAVPLLVDVDYSHVDNLREGQWVEVTGDFLPLVLKRAPTPVIWNASVKVIDPPKDFFLHRE
jgi:hypothetical protein